MSLDSGSENCVCFIRYKNWFTRISVPYDTTKQPSVQHLVNSGCCNILLQNRCIQIFLFPHTILEWNKLDVQIRRSESFLSFKNSLLKIGRPTAKPTYNIHNPIGLKFLTRLRLGLSHLNEHKFKHNFQDCVNPLCSCSLETESLSHFFLHCHHFRNILVTLFDDLQSVDRNIPSFSVNELVDLLLYGSPNFNLNQNNMIPSSSISLIIKSERFSDSFF